MIKFKFSFNNEEVAMIENVSKFSNKKVWQTFEEAVMIHNKNTLINKLADIRDRMDAEDVAVEYNYNPVTEDFEIAYFTSSDELHELITERVNKKP